MLPRKYIVLVLVDFFLIGAMAGAIVTQYPPFQKVLTSSRVLFNEQFITDLQEVPLDLSNPEVVFAHVFNQLPDTVTVYPTENYYYFRFYTNGQLISGNFRLDVADREAGILNFAFFGATNYPTKRSDLDRTRGFKQFTSADGVELTQRSPLEYMVSYGGKSVLFALNDLAQTLPEGMELAEDEQFLGRMMDESGFQFILVFDTEASQFFYVLDERMPLPDVLEEIGSGLLIGRLSGFVFYDDAGSGRKVLFGVDGTNIRRNNYYDGPFDQLSDNFVEGDTLRKALEAAYPYVSGAIDERGIFLDEDGKRLSQRVAITPYLVYRSLEHVRQFGATCREGAVDRAIVRCLTYDYKQDYKQNVSQ